MHQKATDLLLISAQHSNSFQKQQSTRKPAAFSKWLLQAQVGFFDAFKQLIEAAVAQSKGQKAAIVAHSMGSLVSLYFLNKQGQEWRDKNVAVFVAASAPWEGAVTALKGLRPLSLSICV